MKEFCESEDFDKKEFKGKMDYFNHVYKKCDIEEHGHYHLRISTGDY